jgi:hypothetical protein
MSRAEVRLNIAPDRLLLATWIAARATRKFTLSRVTERGTSFSMGA